MSIAVKTDTGWQVLGAGESPGGGATKWGDFTTNGDADVERSWTAPDSQGRIWKYAAYNKPGTYEINLTGGMYWVLCVGGGDAGQSAAGFAEQGQPGLVNEGYWEFGSGTQTITVGHHGANNANANPSQMGGPSSVGDYGTQGYSNWGQSGTGRGAQSHNEPDGYVSNITGDPLEYATGDYGTDRPGRSGKVGNEQRDGCVIIATVDEDKTDYYPPGALPGVGGWATITGIDGTSGTRYQYGDWVAYEWLGTKSSTNTTGSITIGTAGLIDVLCIGAGNQNTHSSLNSDGGHLVAGNLWAAAGDHSVQAAHAGLQNSYNNDRSYLSGVCGVIRCTGIGNGGAGSYLTTGQTDAGFRSSITGTEVEYGPAGNPNAIGGGQTPNTSGAFAGVGAVIVRVPKAHAYLGALPAGWVDA